MSASPEQRRGITIWLVVAAAGTALVWFLSSYIESLTVLGRTDREAAAALFRTRVLPALWIVAALSIAAGVVMVRHGLAAIRTVALAGRGGSPAARLMGMLMVAAGVLMGLIPVALLVAVTWALR